MNSVLYSIFGTINEKVLKTGTQTKSITYTAAGTYTINFPDNAVKNIVFARILCAGGGGGGGYSSTSYTGGGGGSGALCEMVVYLPKDVFPLTVTVGAGGAGGTSTAAGTNGGDSTITTTNEDILLTAGGGAHGGNGSTANGAGGAGGVASFPIHKNYFLLQISTIATNGSNGCSGGVLCQGAYSGLGGAAKIVMEGINIGKGGNAGAAGYDGNAGLDGGFAMLLYY